MLRASGSAYGHVILKWGVMPFAVLWVSFCPEKCIDVTLKTDPVLSFIKNHYLCPIINL